MINYFLLVSRQGKLCLQKWYITLSSKEKAKTIKEVTTLALGRRVRLSNILEYKGRKIVYRRYASLFFICEIDEFDNELSTLEIIHRYVEVLDRYFGEVCELDLIFNFEKAHSALDQLILAGELHEPSREQALEKIRGCDAAEKDDQIRQILQESGFV